jgi:hypothetical protein
VIAAAVVDALSGLHLKFPALDANKSVISRRAAAC